MGRYYSGDIEGKFWFGIQPSQAPERFGAEQIKIIYSVANKEEVDKVIEEIKDNLGNYLEKLDEFFTNNKCYSDNELSKYLGVGEDKMNYLLSEYADLRLGKKISNYLTNDNRCIIEAEL